MRSLSRLRPAAALAVLLMSLVASAAGWVSGAAAPAVADAAVAGRPVRIMPLGDSITWGSGSTTFSSYRAELWRRLVNDTGLAVDFVGSQRNGSLPDPDHEGHPGWRIDQIASSVDGWLATSRPDVVLLHIGTNDMNQNFDVTRAPQRLSALIDRIVADLPAATVVVASIVPAKDPAINARITTFNASVPGIVQAKATAGKHVRHADLNRTLGAADLADILHPNDGGYAKMASLWHSALGPVLAGAPHDWPLLTTGLEPGEPALTWTDTVDASVNVGGFCCLLTKMESGGRAEVARGGSNALMYSGNDTSATQSFSYNRVFDVHLRIAANTVLSYWVYPQQRNGTFVAIDLALSDGGNLRDSGLVDQFGVRAHPRFQGEGGHLLVDQWNLVRVNLGALAGRTIDRVHLGYDQPAGTGVFRGYVDDIRFVDAANPAAAPGTLVNLALKRPATGSAPFVAAESVDKANDGTTGGNSKWASNVGGAWWQVDLGAARTVQRVVLRHTSAGGEPAVWNTRAYRVQTSLDGIDWLTRATVTGNVDGVTSSAFAGVAARYVRVLVDEPTQGVDGATRIYEIEAYGP